MLIPFAKRKSDGLLVDASDVPSGKACGCICPACSRDLVAKHCVNKIDHFAHLADVECSITYESAVHLADKQAIEEIGFIRLPRVHVHSRTTGQKLEIAEGEFHFEKIEVEKFLSDIKPDLTLYSKGGTQLAVEITYRHPTRWDKIERYKELNTSCLEINLSEISPDTKYSQIREIIREGKCGRKWLFNRKVQAFWKADKEISDKLAIEEHRREAVIKRAMRKGVLKLEVKWRKSRFRLYPIPHAIGCPLKKRVYDGNYFANVAKDCKAGCECFFGAFPKYTRNFASVLCGGSAMVLEKEKMRYVTLGGKVYELWRLDTDENADVDEAGDDGEFPKALGAAQPQPKAG